MTQTYTISQWILFFFIYCFAGWVWESCYVSVRQHKWVNRGFLHGPFLPIYGSGALVVLLSTLHVRDNLVLVYIMGLTGATILEYFTGAAMEKLFHVRYWDYSNQRFNLNGHICLTSSVAWGFFSILLVHYIHIPIENFVLKLPALAADAIGFVLTACTAVDFTQSFNEAMDMKNILIQLEESREQIKAMQEKLKLASEEAIEEAKEEYRQFAEQRTMERLSRKEAYLARINESRENKKRQLNELTERVEFLLREEIPSKVEEMIGEDKTAELTELKHGIMREFQKMGARTDKSYLRAAEHLRRNPSAVSEKFKEALQELREYMDEK